MISLCNLKPKYPATACVSPEVGSTSVGLERKDFGKVPFWVLSTFWFLRPIPGTVMVRSRSKSLEWVKTHWRC